MQRFLQFVPGLGQHGLEAAHQLVLALGASVEALQTFGDTALHALVETGLEVQAVVLLQAAPVATVQGGVVRQEEGAGHIAAILPGEHQTNGIGHCFAKHLEECRREIGMLAALEVGRGVERIEGIPDRRRQLATG